MWIVTIATIYLIHGTTFALSGGNRLTSTNYPNTYPNNEDTVQTLSVPGGYNMLITVQEFQLEADKKCSYDYVQICDDNKICGLKLCGSSSPDPITVSTSTATVVFHSDESVSRKGFSLTYKKIKPEVAAFSIVGPSALEGNIFYGGRPICDDHWDNTDAGVFCRMMGYQNGNATYSSAYGEVSPDFSMDDVQCNGHETNLLDCNHTTQHNCGSSEGAGVICSGPDEVALILGGQGNKKVELWSPSGKCNRQLKDLPVYSDGITTNYVNGLILSCGGYTWKNKCFYLNPETEDWVFHSTMLRKRNYHSSFVMNGTTLYLVGDSWFESSSIEYLVPGSTTWREGPAGNVAAGSIRYGTCSLQTSSSTFIVTGGNYRTKYPLEGKYNLSSILIGEEYNFITKEWRTFGNADEAKRMYHGCAMIHTENVYGILIAGGSEGNVTTSSYFLDLNEKSPAWNKSSDMNFPHQDGRIVKLNNRYFILGGETSRKVEEYHPHNGTWTSGLPDVRYEKDQMYGVTAVPSNLFPNCN